jgi:nitronate monooxygenase
MRWPERLSQLLGVRYPIIQAPMAGGFTPPRLVAEVSEAGALGSLGAAVLSPEQIREAVAEIRSLTDEPFGVNLFAPQPSPAFDPEQAARIQAEVRDARDELGLPEPEPPKPPGWTQETQLQAIVEARPPVFSFTFGPLSTEPLREAGSVVLGSATTVAEAVELERLGVDAVVVQSSEAGGHRGTFLGSFEESLVGGIALLPQIDDAVSLPLVAAGGIMDGRGIAAALALGADGVQLGTAFLGCPESGASDGYREALARARDDGTLVTPGVTGRHARWLRTSLVERLAGLEPLPYPLQAALLADIRKETSNPDLALLLAGQAASLVRRLPAAELVETLVRETEETIAGLGG